MGLSFLNLLWATNTIKESIPTAESIAKAILDEQEMRKMEEEAYWSAWDMEEKRGVIERLRNHDNTFALLTFHQKPIYPNMTQDEQADLIESGELKVIAPTKEQGPLGAIWVDNEREEAKNPMYLRLKTEIVDKLISEKGYRIVS